MVIMSVIPKPRMSTAMVLATPSTAMDLKANRALPDPKENKDPREHVLVQYLTKIIKH
jgi:hypothetical protein